MTKDLLRVRENAGELQQEVKGIKVKSPKLIKLKFTLSSLLLSNLIADIDKMLEVNNEVSKQQVEAVVEKLNSYHNRYAELMQQVKTNANPPSPQSTHSVLEQIELATTKEEQTQTPSAWCKRLNSSKNRKRKSNKAKDSLSNSPLTLYGQVLTPRSLLVSKADLANCKARKLVL
jgi:small-conductance mechanosensitive channel